MLWINQDCVRIVFGSVPKRMRVVWFSANTCNVPCMGVANHAPNTNFMTQKTALFDGIFRAKRCGTVIPHRDFRSSYV